jgi:hypothetical protein
LATTISFANENEKINPVAISKNKKTWNQQIW